MDSIERVWIVSFESKNICKVGGLGEAVSSLSLALRGKGVDSIVITPSHGGIDSVRERYSVREIARAIHKGREVIVYEVNTSPPHIVVSSSILEDEHVYSGDMASKIDYFKAGVLVYAKKMLEDNIYPDIIHGNDWHSIPVLLALKNLYNNLGIYPGIVYQIHLLSRMKIDREYLEYYGFNPHAVIKYYYRGCSKRNSFLDTTSLSRGLLERYIGLVADCIASVSRNYMEYILGFLGRDLREKACIIYNGTSWDYRVILEEVCRQHGLSITREGIGREKLVLRKYLLLEALGRLGDNEPFIAYESVREYLCRVKKYPFRGCGRVHPFREDGPLIVMTGRLVRQKGFDIIVDRVEDIVYRYNKVKILLFPLPVSNDTSLIERLVSKSMLFHENLRVVIGYTPSIYKLAHIAANVYVAPSRYEPFGLMALESMAVGTPVVAFKTGGLAETILDIRENGVLGTGLLIDRNCISCLIESIVDLALFMETSYYKPWSTVWRSLVENIVDEELKTLLLKNPSAPEKIRESCIRRAKEFSWDRSASMALECYRRALEKARVYRD